MNTLASAFIELQKALASVHLGQGTTEIADEAAWLLLGTLQLPLDTDLSDPTIAQQPLDHEHIAALSTQLQRRVQQRIPTAYLLQEAWLQGFSFYIDPRSIIPRSLIAEPLMQGLIDSFMPQAPQYALDLCTGNGSLAILMALAWPSIPFIDAADCSSDALDIARINIDKYQLNKRITCYQGDSWKALDPHRRYDLVLCNPPYVNSMSMQQLPPEFCQEPTLALAGGDDGMDFIRPMLKAAQHHLSDQGILVLEIGHEYKHFLNAFPQLPLIGLPTSSGDDLVLLLQASDLALL